MDTIWANDSGVRTYRAVKAHVIAHAFPSGRRIYLQPIADALGVSTTPVREAMDRLAAEDLVIKAPRKGFIAISLSRDNLLNYYEFTRLLLAKEVEWLNAAARQNLSGFEPVSGVLLKLNRRLIADEKKLATYTGTVFSQIASLSGNAHIVRSIRRANDHLYYIRTIECELLEGVQSELVLLCELVLARLCKDLLQAIHRYHDSRIEVLPALLELSKQ